MWALGTMRTRYRITKETLKTLVQGTGGEIYRLERKIYKRRKTRTGRYYMEGYEITSIHMTKEYAEKIGFIRYESSSD